MMNKKWVMGLPMLMHCTMTLRMQWGQGKDGLLTARTYCIHGFSDSYEGTPDLTTEIESVDVWFKVLTRSVSPSEQRLDLFLRSHIQKVSATDSDQVIIELQWMFVPIRRSSLQGVFETSCSQGDRQTDGQPETPWQNEVMENYKKLQDQWNIHETKSFNKLNC